MVGGRLYKKVGSVGVQTPLEAAECHDEGIRKQQDKYIKVDTRLYALDSQSTVLYLREKNISIRYQNTTPSLITIQHIRGRLVSWFGLLASSSAFHI